MISATAVEYDGYEYRAMMPGVQVDGTAMTCHGSSTCRPLPSGYEIAPNDPGVINNVIAPFNWNTAVMVTYSSAGSSGGYPGYRPDIYGMGGEEWSPGSAKAISCSGGWKVSDCSLQILIRKPSVIPAGAVCKDDDAAIAAAYGDDFTCELMASFSLCHQVGPEGEGAISDICECSCERKLAFVDDTSCQWHAMNKLNKVINANQFFGFECPPNQIISELRLEGYGARSVLENNPTAILCCELGGYSLVTNTCVDSFSTADGILEAAICQGNSAMAAIYDLSDPTLEQGQWQYQATKAVTCCDIEYDTSYGHNLDLGIDRSQCEVISHSNQVGSFDVSCPEDMILIAIRDNDLAHGVQEVHEVECCKVHQVTAPSKAPTATPTTDQPSSAPTTSCYRCLIEVHGNNVSDQDDFVGEIQACLSHCCA